MDTRISLIQKVIRDLPTNIPLVVCSKNNNTNIMMDCIHAGAKDYLTKPFHLDTIKTLFLKTHQNQPCLKVHHSPLHQRIKEMTFYDVPKMITSMYAHSQSTIKYTAVSEQRTLELQPKLCSWNFSPFESSEQDLIECVYIIFDQMLSLPELYHLSSLRQNQLYDFIVDLSGVYHDDNPYHNFAHAVDVLQCLFYMLCELGVLPFTNKTSNQKKPQDLLSPTDIFALLIAAIGHDAAHPGVNNAFLINTSNPLATLYNDRSILENLHSVTLFQLLNKHGIDKLLGDPLDFRKIVISSILATDMAFHAEYVEKIKAQAKRLESVDTNTLDFATREKERLLLCSALVKCADISNVARDFRFSQQWAKLLVQEFTTQGDLERELGLPVLPMNDSGKIILEDSQIGFIKFVALDLFQSVCQVMSELSFAVDQLKINLERWEEIKEDDAAMVYVTEKRIKRSLSIDDSYSSTKRISLDKYNINMPLIAMTTYGHVNTTEDQEKDPANCHCSIQ
ncbi:unnamed protein product [Rhizopus stolonifer]